MKRYGYIGAKVSPAFKAEITAAVENGIHLNESELIREAVRDKLKELKAVEEGD